jgi:hypothetical protein
MIRFMKHWGLNEPEISLGVIWTLVILQGSEMDFVLLLSLLFIYIRQTFY